MNKIKHNNQQGFTLVELMIATTVFSTILLLATTGVINIGKLYYKGITTARTQEATRSVASEVASSAQLTKGEIKNSVDDPNNPYSAVCIGNDRYTYRIDDTSVGDEVDTHGLWLDEITEGSECRPYNFGDPGSEGNDGEELLGDNMRLIDFLVRTNANEDNTIDETEINIKVGVAYGASDLLTTYDNNGVYQGPNRADAQCKSANSGSSFCAVSSLETFVKRRIL